MNREPRNPDEAQGPQPPPATPPTPADGTPPRLSPPPQAPPQSPHPTIESLLLRMRHGDRQAAAEFIVRYGDRIRRRVRSRLPAATRRVFDSSDILSTLSRRLDDYVSGRKLEATTEAQLWSLVFRIADNATVDKSRVMARLRNVEGEDTPFAVEFLGRLERAQSTELAGAEIELDKLIAGLDDPVDRQILSLWLADTPHTVTAECVGLTPGAVRKRWQSIKVQLRTLMQTGGA